METLYAVDSSLFVTINQSIANPVTDLLMPWFTNDIVLRLVFLGMFIALIIKGPARLRWLALGGLIAIGVADQLSSAALKPLFARLRPCQNPSFSESLHLLVNCGAGKSFPSSHAANAFAVASFFSFGLADNSRKALVRSSLICFALVVAASRVFVGVHFPGDILAGAALGSLVGLALAIAFRRLDRTFSLRTK